MNSEVRINFAKNMNVIGHDLKFDDLTFQIISDLLNDFLQPNIYAIYKYLAAILRTENNMVLAGVNNMTIAFIRLCTHSTELYNYSLYSAKCKVKVKTVPYTCAARQCVCISTTKGGSFTEHLIKPALLITNRRGKTACFRHAKNVSEHAGSGGILKQRWLFGNIIFVPAAPAVFFQVNPVFGVEDNFL
jgi:hypothetical protein